MTQVAIAGGGVGGLCTALALAQLGYQSAVIDSRPSPATVDRGDILHAGVLPLLRHWGVGDDIAAQAPLRFHEFRISDYTGRVLLHADTTALLGAEHHFTALRHPTLTRTLRDAASRTGLIELVDGHRVTDLLTDNGRVCGVRTATRCIPATLTVVATGARSGLAARALGRPEVYPYRSAFYNACVEAIDAYTATGYYVLGPDGAMVLVPLPDGRHRIGIQIRAQDLKQVAATDFFTRTVARRFAPFADDPPRPVERPHTYRLYRAITPRWWRPGAVLLGDAAHQVHPTGGQGMNLAIRDVQALAASLVDAGCPTTTSGTDAPAAAYAAHRANGIRPALRRTHMLGLAAERAPFWAINAAALLADHSTSIKRALLLSMMDVR